MSGVRLKSRNHEKRGCFAGNSIEGDMLPVPVQRDFESRADDASAPLSGIRQFGETRKMYKLQTPDKSGESPVAIGGWSG